MHLLLPYYDFPQIRIRLSEFLKLGSKASLAYSWRPGNVVTNKYDFCLQNNGSETLSYVVMHIKHALSP